MNTNIEKLEGKPLNGQTYWCVQLDTDPELAKRAFVTHFQAEPENIFEDSRMLWLGPIPSLEDTNVNI